MTLEVRTAPDPIAADCTSGVPPIDGSAGRHAELGRGAALELTDHGGGRDEVGQLGAVDAGQREQRGVVVDARRGRGCR